MARKAVGEKAGMPPGGMPAVRVWAMAGEVGLLIVLPLLLFLFAGIRLDRWAGTTPLFIILGLLASLTLSALAVARKIRRVQQGQP